MLMSMTMPMLMSMSMSMPMPMLMLMLITMPASEKAAHRVARRRWRPHARMAVPPTPTHGGQRAAALLGLRQRNSLSALAITRTTGPEKTRRDERGETRDERRETRDERGETREETRETREGRGARREERGEKREERRGGERRGGEGSQSFFPTLVHDGDAWTMSRTHGESDEFQHI